MCLYAGRFYDREDQNDPGRRQDHEIDVRNDVKEVSVLSDSTGTATLVCGADLMMAPASRTTSATKKVYTLVAVSVHADGTTRTGRQADASARHKLKNLVGEIQKLISQTEKAGAKTLRRSEENWRASQSF